MLHKFFFKPLAHVFRTFIVLLSSNDIVHLEMYCQENGSTHRGELSNWFYCGKAVNEVCFAYGTTRISHQYLAINEFRDGAASTAGGLQSVGGLSSQNRH